MTVTFEGADTIPHGVDDLLTRKRDLARELLGGSVKTLAIELESLDPGSAIIAQYVSYKLTYALDD